MEWIVKTGRKPGIDKILISKRGENFSPLFILLFSLLLFHGYSSAQVYSSHLFPDSIEYKLEILQLPEYSINTFYNHTYKYSVNDTTVAHIYKAQTYQSIALPLKNNSILRFGHSYNDYYTGYKDHVQKHHLYNKQKYHDLMLSYIRFNTWYNVNLHYGYRLSEQVEDIGIGLALNYKGFTLQPKYQSMANMISSHFDSDSLSIDAKNYIDHKSYILTVGYLGNKISAHFKMTSVLANPDVKRNDLGLGLNTGTSRLQYDSRISYRIEENINVWGTAYYQIDTCEVPIYWTDRKIGEFTAIDDTLWSSRIGLNINHHGIAFGTGRWYGNLWISQLSPSPFLPVWATLSGTKYYLDLGSDMRFTGLFYSYQLSNKKWENSIGVNSLNFSGSIDGEQWAITFPFTLTVHDKLDVQIHKLHIIETNIVISKQITAHTKVKFWTKFLLPINIKITVSPELPEKPPKKDVDGKVTGGIQAGISLSYYF